MSSRTPGITRQRLAVLGTFVVILEFLALPTELFLRLSGVVNDGLNMCRTKARITEIPKPTHVLFQGIRYKHGKGDSRRQELKPAFAKSFPLATASTLSSLCPEEGKSALVTGRTVPTELSRTLTSRY